MDLYRVECLNIGINLLWINEVSQNKMNNTVLTIWCNLVGILAMVLSIISFDVDQICYCTDCLNTSQDGYVMYFSLVSRCKHFLTKWKTFSIGFRSATSGVSFALCSLIHQRQPFPFRGRLRWIVVYKEDLAFAISFTCNFEEGGEMPSYNAGEELWVHFVIWFRHYNSFIVRYCHKQT